MKKFLFSFAVVSLFFGFIGVHEARAGGSCADPAYLATHINDCWDEFSACFEGYDGVWDAAIHLDDILQCITDEIEQEAEELVDEVIDAAGGSDQAEASANKIMDAIFGADNTAHAVLDDLQSKANGVRQSAVNTLKDLITQARGNRQDARKNLKSFLENLIQSRNETRKEFRNKIKTAIQNAKSALQQSK